MEGRKLRPRIRRNLPTEQQSSNGVFRPWKKLSIRIISTVYLSVALSLSLSLSLTFSSLCLVVCGGGKSVWPFGCVMRVANGINHLSLSPIATVYGPFWQSGVSFHSFSVFHWLTLHNCVYEKSKATTGKWCHCCCTNGYNIICLNLLP